MKNLVKAEFDSSFTPPHTFSPLSSQWRSSQLPDFLCLLSILLSLSVLALLANITNVGKPLSFEPAILFYLHAYASSALDMLALAISVAATVISVAVLIYLLYRRFWRTTFFWLATMLGAEFFTQITKKFFQHSRPQLWDVVAQQSSFSFPSGHATQSMALVLAFFLIVRYSRTCSSSHIAIAAAFVAAVALSRMYLGLHYPTEIIAGWALATAWVCMLALIYRHGRRTLGAGKAL